MHLSTVSAKRLLDSDGGHSLVASACRNALLGCQNRDDSTGRARMLEASFTGKVEPVQNPLDILRGHERENMCITHMSEKQSVSGRSPKYDGHRGERPMNNRNAPFPADGKQNGATRCYKVFARVMDDVCGGSLCDWSRPWSIG